MPEVQKWRCSIVGPIAVQQGNSANGENAGLAARAIRNELAHGLPVS